MERREDEYYDFPGSYAKLDWYSDLRDRVYESEREREINFETDIAARHSGSKICVLGTIVPTAVLTMNTAPDVGSVFPVVAGGAAFCLTHVFANLVTRYSGNLHDHTYERDMDRWISSNSGFLDREEDDYLRQRIELNHGRAVGERVRGFLFSAALTAGLACAASTEYARETVKDLNQKFKGAVAAAPADQDVMQPVLARLEASDSNLPVREM